MLHPPFGVDVSAALLRVGCAWQDHIRPRGPAVTMMALVDHERPGADRVRTELVGPKQPHEVQPGDSRHRRRASPGSKAEV